ncbi:CHASE2 domain-containing protein [Ancylothrix sp. C2]|uniref:CHASE2 domain-containing protein n=1 Tax=Ancylothrix sp. D3o TaxID=2953691 RepID=UPI0021BB9694|nr:CHASE2 domain-containing protein [Ancylothrix sp. D3o]MCT7952933.1 CHASE2 domain-containing protein [Ancylothrix sp. D3o]
MNADVETFRWNVFALRFLERRSAFYEGVFFVNKLVILELDGDLENRGVRVTLEVGEDGVFSKGVVKIKGVLPAHPNLAYDLRNHWQDSYRNLGLSPRIKSKKIIHKGSINSRIAECKESAGRLSTELKKWLKSDGFRAIDLHLREELNRDEMVRFLICTQDADIQKLPWQEWDFFRRYGKAELAISPLESKPIIEFKSSREEENSVKILAILGNKEGIDIEADIKVLKTLPNAELVFLAEPTHQEINAELWEKGWDIIFFAGHSQTEGNKGRIYINSTDSLTITELWYGLKKAVERGLKLAIFNSCDGLGLARELEDLQIPQMIVMRELVPDQIAQEFLKFFLKNFAEGMPLYLAVREARQRLHDDFEKAFPCASWLPVICQQPAQFPPTWEQLKSKKPVQKDSEKTRRFSRIFRQDVIKTNLFVSLTVTVLVMAMRSLGVFQSWEFKAFDTLMRLRPPEPIDSRLLVVEATEEDINLYGFPLPDQVLLQAIERLQTYQPKVIGLDIYRPRFSANFQQLFRQFKENNLLVGVCSAGEVNNANKPGIKPPPGLPESRMGFTDVVVDGDGILRRHLIFMQPVAKDPCVTQYALSARVALKYLAEKGIEPQLLSRYQIKIGEKMFQDLEIHTGGYQNLDRGGFQVLLNYRKKEPFRVTLSQIIKGEIKPDLVKNKIILIGVSAPISGDDFSTPYSAGKDYYEKMPGVLVQAQMVSQIISAVLDNRPLLTVWNVWGEAVAVWMSAMVGGLVVFCTFRRRELVLFMAGMTGILWGVSLVFLIKGFWVPVVPAFLAMIVTVGVIAVNIEYEKQSLKINSKL